MTLLDAILESWWDRHRTTAPCGLAEMSTVITLDLAGVRLSYEGLGDDPGEPRTNLALPLGLAIPGGRS
jgi:hypothetical protein